ncbi:flagellar biosynthetic protein FliO [Alkalicoccobacillus gibsonii]|uniref:flagellar biosynthetic protein FliO n=1 Tax=Alkalicoccobacillus gibsonii TaxID=79881 RepID=UPI001AEE4056|nr:flagellar biosynthetic protein FliO [Alkalicoccobacillus gibsonii]
MRLTRHLRNLLPLVLLVVSIMLSPAHVAEAADCNGMVDDSFKEECDSASLGETGTTDDAQVPAGVPGNGFLTVLKLIGSLALIIALMYGLVRFLGKRTKTFRQSQVLENIGGMPLGPNRSIQLIKVGDRVLVVGVGESIQLLKEIDSEQELDELKRLQEDQDQANLQVPAQKAFDWIKSRVTRSKNQSETQSAAVKTPTAFQDLFQEKLQEASKSQVELEKVMKERQP